MANGFRLRNRAATAATAWPPAGFVGRRRIAKDGHFSIRKSAGNV